MKQDKHSQAIPKEIVEQALAKLNEVKVLLAPYLLALTAQERGALLKMGEKTLAFVEKAFELAKQNLHLCPTFLNLEEFLTDLRDAD